MPVQRIKEIATGEQMWLHVDMKAGRTTPFKPPLKENIAALAAAHSASASWGWPFYWGKVEGNLPMPLCAGKLADDRWRAIRIYIPSLAEKLMSNRKSVGQGRGQLTLTQ